MNTVDRKLAQEINILRGQYWKLSPELAAMVDAAITAELASQAEGNPPAEDMMSSGDDYTVTFGDAATITPGQNPPVTDVLSHMVPDITYDDWSAMFPATQQPSLFPALSNIGSDVTVFPTSGGSIVGGGGSPSPSILGVINAISNTVNSSINSVMVPVTTLLKGKILINTLKAQATAASGGAAATGQGTAALFNALGSSGLVWALVGIGGLALVLNSGRRR